MSVQRSLRVTDPVFSEFNALKIRLAISTGNNIPAVSAIITAMLAVSNSHYDELLTALPAGEKNSSE